MDNKIDPILDDEIVYRRVPASQNWYDPATGILHSSAFAPHKTLDVTGLSVARGKYKEISEAAVGRAGKLYYIVELRAGDLRAKGIEVVPRPRLPDGTFDPAHAELPDLNSANRKDDETLNRQSMIADQLKGIVHGPFLTPDDTERQVE